MLYTPLLGRFIVEYPRVVFGIRGRRLLAVGFRLRIGILIIALPCEQTRRKTWRSRVKFSVVRGLWDAVQKVSAPEVVGAV
jgi:hypothetical protein